MGDAGAADKSYDLIVIGAGELNNDMYHVNASSPLTMNAQAGMDLAQPNPTLNYTQLKGF